MSSLGMTVNRYILQQEHRYHEATGEFSEILTQIVTAAKLVSREVNKAGLVEILGFTGTRNTSDEEQRKLDVYANEIFKQALSQNCYVSAIASEEDPDVVVPPPQERPGRYVVSLDPLDGSSNIDVNVSIGTIFSIHRQISPDGKGDQDLLQLPRNQMGAGYVLYGSSTMLVYSTGRGVQGFTLDPSLGEFLLSHENLRMPKRGGYYSTNEGNWWSWPEGVRDYVAHLKDPAPHGGKPYSLRYVGSLVADFHRTLLYGGIFMYPTAKMRLLYEAAPLAFIAEHAGGRASDGEHPILDIQPTSLHQRIPLYIGSTEDVAEAESFLRRRR